MDVTPLKTTDGVVRFDNVTFSNVTGWKQAIWFGASFHNCTFPDPAIPGWLKTVPVPVSP